jgi:chromosome segregation ATPase
MRRRLSPRSGDLMTNLVPLDNQENEELDGLRARIAELEAVLDRRADEVAELKAELHLFKLEYRREVGVLYDQLDELEIAIAEAELGELKSQLGQSEPQNPPPATPRPLSAEAARFTSDAIRKLFRDVAKAIHPDLARDEQARDRRHALMAEANRAYADGDAEQLRMILHKWERSPESVLGNDSTAIRLRLTQRIAQAHDQLAALQLELDELRASPLAELKAKIDEASSNGKDLVADMVVRLKRDIMVAANRLAAIRPLN